jgi:hypothetical protein
MSNHSAIETGLINSDSSYNNYIIRKSLYQVEFAQGAGDWE